MATVPVLTEDWVDGETVTLTDPLFLFQLPRVAVIQSYSSIMKGAGQDVAPFAETLTFVLSPKPFAGSVLLVGEMVYVQTFMIAKEAFTAHAMVMGPVVYVSPDSAPPHPVTVSILYPASGVTVNEVLLP